MSMTREQAYTFSAATETAGTTGILYDLVIEEKPAVIVEIGTETAVSTKALDAAAELVGAKLYTIDKDPDCEKQMFCLPNVTFIGKPGEDALADTPTPEFLFIDTSPHTYEQTIGWLDTWVQRLPVGRMAAFHDSAIDDPATGFGVGAALAVWCQHHPEWERRDYDVRNGLTTLRRLA